jgi:hypothetical protein
MPPSGIPSLFQQPSVFYLNLYFFSSHDMCLAWSIVYDMNFLLSLLFDQSHESLLYTPILREPKWLQFVRMAHVLHLNPFELWNCSYASLISFWARCALLVLKKISLASLKPFWEIEILCSWSSLIFVWAFQKQHIYLVPKW